MCRSNNFCCGKAEDDGVTGEGKKAKRRWETAWSDGFLSFGVQLFRLFVTARSPPALLWQTVQQANQANLH